MYWLWNVLLRKWFIRSEGNKNKKEQQKIPGKSGDEQLSVAAACGEKTFAVLCDPMSKLY